MDRMLPGIGDYREPYDEYIGYLWDDLYVEDDEESEDAQDA